MTSNLGTQVPLTHTDSRSSRRHTAPRLLAVFAALLGVLAAAIVVATVVLVRGDSSSTRTNTDIARNPVSASAISARRLPSRSHLPTAAPPGPSTSADTSTHSASEPTAPQPSKPAGRACSLDQTKEITMRNPRLTHLEHCRLWAQRALPAALIVADAAGLSACKTQAGASETGGSPNSGASTVQAGPAPDGGYTCLRDTGGASGQCNAAMGTGRPRQATASAGPPLDTPNECIRINGGDYNACNLGNSRRGDLPYRPVH